MTGRYPGRMGLAIGVLRPDAVHGMPPEEVTLAEVFKSRGYVTGCIGKWHLGYQARMRPMEQGFDSYFGVPYNLDRFETVQFQDQGGTPVLRGDRVEKRPAVPAEMTGLYTDEALKFIEAHREKPFFLYLAHAMPHLPFEASEPFKGKSGRGEYGDVVQELDASTGRILELLRRQGLAERTLVLFTSDNGPERNTPASAGPFSGTKHTVHEGGLRVPFIAWWPGTVPANRVCDEFITALDLLPTAAALSGAAVPPEIDGQDIAPILLGTPGAKSPPDKMLYSLYGLNRRRLESIRAGHWKLHLAEPGRLYDLRADPSESHDVAGQHAELVADLVRRAQQKPRPPCGE
jgi:arylsulfatase A